MKFLELQIYNSENYKYEIMRIPIMVYESRIKGQGTTGAQLRILVIGEPEAQVARANRLGRATLGVRL